MWKSWQWTFSQQHARVTYLHKIHVCRCNSLVQIQINLQVKDNKFRNFIWKQVEPSTFKRFGNFWTFFCLKEHAGVFDLDKVWSVITKTLYRKATDAIPFKCKQNALLLVFVLHRLCTAVSLYIKNISYFPLLWIRNISALCGLNARRATGTDDHNTCMSRRLKCP